MSLIFRSFYLRKRTIR